MFRNLSIVTVCISLILATVPTSAQPTESKNLESALAALALRQDFPQIGDIQASLHVVFSDETPIVTSTFYKAQSNRWGITTVTVGDPRNQIHGMSITLDGSSCATAIGVARFAGVAITHNWALGVDGGPGYRAISARIGDRRELSFWAASDHDCLTQVRLREYPPAH
ncbi:hypothetical protein [Dyella sp. S184]|uniref:hypothetical protein n=1 Tax=Dyella sp. S184 TaxID=1641862 RepID=UPI00131DD351|nr:hypothetical protein [Dyella sp. S184]